MNHNLEGMGIEDIWYVVGVGLKEAGDEAIGSRALARRIKDWTSHPFWAGLEDRI